MIRAEYLNGATARDLAKKYRTSPTSIYRHACKEGWTKEAMAESVSRKSVVDAERAAAEEIASKQQDEDEMIALVERIASEEDAADIASAIERRALAQASAAMVQGRSKEAQALASMAEQMRKRSLAAASTPLSMQRANDGLPSKALSPEELEQRAWMQASLAMERGKPADAKAMAAVAEKMRKRVEDQREAERAQAEEVEIDRAQNEESAMWLFGAAAQLAGAMVHHPNSAPGAFLQMIKRWREINLGEGEEDAEARATVVAKAKQRHLDGSWEENTPEDVRQYLQARWTATRKVLAEE
jgi:hypothetical protein